MIEVLVTTEVEASADALWSIVSDFGTVDWMNGVSKVEIEGEGPGMVRLIFASPDGPPIREQLESIDEDARCLRYGIPEGNPLPVDDYHSHMTVVDLGDGRSRLDWGCSAVAKGTDEAAAQATVEGMYGVLVSWVKAKAEA